MDIALADRTFDKAHFLAGARTAYEIIQKAFATGDRLALRPLLSDDVFAAPMVPSRHGRKTSGKQCESLAGITDARIVEARAERQRRRRHGGVPRPVSTKAMSSAMSVIA